MAELIRKVGISEQTFYRWKKQRTSGWSWTKPGKMVQLGKRKHPVENSW